MAWTFNPFTGSFDQKGSGGGGGASYIDGEVQNFSALPETLGTPPVDSAYLVREAEGTWLINRKPAGIYIRTANTGTRASDWTHAGAFPDVFNDANFILYDNADSTKNLAFQLSGITTGTTRTLTAPDATGRIQVEGQAIGNTTPAAGTFTTLAANNGTLTASAPALDISQTWNDSGTKFTAFKLNATNTASNVESILADFQVDGVSIFSINDNGVGINGGTWATFSETFSSAVLMGGVWYVNNGIAFNVAASRGPLSCVAQLGANQSIGWSSNNQPANANADLRFHREGAGILGQRNGTNAQEFRLYNTWTSASNYEALAVKWAANVVSLGPTAGGSGGTVRELHISGLPTSNPGPGILWDDAGTVKVGT